jgi:hypothetical protein
MKDRRPRGKEGQDPLDVDRRDAECYSHCRGMQGRIDGCNGVWTLVLTQTNRDKPRSRAEGTRSSASAQPNWRLVAPRGKFSRPRRPGRAGRTDRRAESAADVVGPEMGKTATTSRGRSDPFAGDRPFGCDRCTMRGSRPGAEVGRLALQGPEIPNSLIIHRILQIVKKKAAILRECPSGCYR